MDDLKAVREFRAEVPEAGPDRLAVIHDRWTASAQPNTTGRARAAAAGIGVGLWLGRIPRLGWGLAVTSGLVVTLGVAVVLAQSGTGPARQAKDPAITTPAITTVSSTGFLLGVADKVQTRHADRPRADQWIYIKKVIPHVDGSGKVEYRPAETWWRVDGAQYAWIGDSGAVEVGPVRLAGDDRSPAKLQRYLESLPTDPEAPLDRIYQDTGETDAGKRDEQAFSDILVLLRDATLVSPQVNAALFRALALIPDVRMTDEVVDVAGRHGVGISRGRADGTREELILDGGSGAYLGQRLLVDDAARVNAGHPALPVVHDGEVLHAEASLATTVVSRAGQRC